MTKRILSLMLVFAMLLPVAGCGAWNEFWDEFNRTNNTEPTNPTDSTEPTDSTKPTGNGENTDDYMKMDEYARPFWVGNTMYDESVLLVAKTDEKGNVIEAPRAKLLFSADKIESVTWYFHEKNGTKIKTLKEGVDFVYEDGYLVALGSIVRNAILELDEFATSVPYVTDKMLTGEQAFPGLSLKSDIPSKTEGLYLPFTEGRQIVQMQLCVTYTHESDLWTGTVPAYLGDSTLQKTVTKLKNKEDVNLLVLGSSTCTGANSSSVLGIAPNLPIWPEMFADELSSIYGSEIHTKNISVGGWTSSNGVGGGTGWVNGVQVQKPGLATQFASGEVKDFKPDLAIIGFGMNDATANMSIDTFCNNIMSMINTIRQQNPDCEIILMGTHLANPLAKNQSKNQKEFNEYLKRISENNDGVAMIDIGAMHQDMLDMGKHYTEMTSNNVNHPNDFLARIYAMNLLASVVIAS